MKKISLAIIVQIMVLTLCALPCAQAVVRKPLEAGRMVRIGLSSLGKHKSFILETSTGYGEIFDNKKKVAIYTGKASNIEVKIASGNKIRIRVDKSKNFSYFTGEVMFTAIGRGATYLNIRPSSKSKAKSYRGSIAIYPTNSSLFAVNEIEIENYLKSVVPSEIFNNGPANTLDAQAVAARTYTIRNLDRHKKDNFNLCDKVHCQAYSGMVREYGNTSEAVIRTQGRILTFNKLAANTVYHANCGGILIDSRAAWNGAAVPYLVSHVDGVKGQKLFCEIGRDLKRNKNPGKLPVKINKLIVRSLPSKTKRRYHRSHGHRVGMCQDGAIGMGAIGYTYREILAFYYPGTRLETMNYARPTTAPSTQPLVVAQAQPVIRQESSSNYVQEAAANPTQKKTIRMGSVAMPARRSTSIISTLKDISASRRTPPRGAADFRKIFWNPAQPEMSNSFF